MKKVLITGVSKGIGRAITEKFIQEGYEIIGTFCHDEDKANELIEKYGIEKVKLLGPYDFTKLKDIEDFVNIAKSYRYDSIVCNSGIFSENDDFRNFDISEFQKTMNCNFYSQLYITVGLQDNINENGSIVLMSSNDAYPGAFASMSYSISKSATISLMKCLAVNFGLKNVRVNSIAPGAIDTDMNTDEQMNIAPFFTPISRVGKPIDVAQVVYFLASDASSFISGENITIDGGYSIVSILLKSEANPLFSQCVQKFIKENK